MCFTQSEGNIVQIFYCSFYLKEQFTFVVSTKNSTVSPFFAAFGTLDLNSG